MCLENALVSRDGLGGADLVPFVQMKPDGIPEREAGSILFNDAGLRFLSLFFLGVDAFLEIIQNLSRSHPGVIQADVVGSVDFEAGGFAAASPVRVRAVELEIVRLKLPIANHHKAVHLRIE